MPSKLLVRWLFNFSLAGKTIVFGLWNEPRITRHPFAAFNGIGAQCKDVRYEWSDWWDVAL